jgi:hypothetical protein
MSIGINERINSDLDGQRELIDLIMAQIHVAMPGIIESFDPLSQTAVIRPALREGIKDAPSALVQDVELPLLADVPVAIPRGGGYCVTLPVKPGDECLVIFADSCIDAWWAYAGVQNQAERRRHDLSDAIAVIGITSQPRRLPDYPTDRMTLRSEAGSSLIEVTENTIKLSEKDIAVEITEEGVSVSAKTVTVNADSAAVNAGSISMGAENISMSAENISLKAEKTISVSAPNDPDGVVDITGWTAALTQLKPG